MNNNSVKIVAIVCGTALGIFLLYQFVFSPYARCVKHGGELKSILSQQFTVKEVDREYKRLKASCSKT